MPTSLAGRPSTCSLGLPVVLQTLDVSAEHRRAWKARALSHGIDSFHVQPGVNATDVATMSTHVPPKLSSLRLTEDDQRMALKKIAMWVVQRGFHARVASGEWGSDGAVLLEDDVHLDAHFCARVSRALGALPADGAWDVLFLGHCGESYGGIRSCNRTARQPAEFLSRGAYPMCTHAFAVSPRGASRLYRLLAGWPSEYVDAVAAKLPRRDERRPTKSALDLGHDVKIAKLVDAKKIEAYLVWPQLALQPWQKRPPSRGGRLASLAYWTSDTRIPAPCLASHRR